MLSWMPKNSMVMKSTSPHVSTNAEVLGLDRSVKADKRYIRSTCGFHLKVGNSAVQQHAPTHSLVTFQLVLSFLTALKVSIHFCSLKRTALICISITSFFEHCIPPQSSHHASLNITRLDPGRLVHGTYGSMGTRDVLQRRRRPFEG
jgi:hypothetical protein